MGFDPVTARAVNWDSSGLEKWRLASLISLRSEFDSHTLNMKITVPIPDKISLNKIYAGVHFRERSNHKSEYHFAVLAGNPEPYSGPFPVHMHYHFRLHGTRLDVSNHAYMLKMVEDGLVACGVLPGDEPKYVAGITITSEKDQADEVDITITPC